MKGWSSLHLRKHQLCQKSCDYLYSLHMYSLHVCISSLVCLHRDNWIVIHPDNEMLFSAEKKWAIKPWKDTEESQRHISKWKKPIRKGYILSDSNCMISWKRQNYGDSKKIIDILGQSSSRRFGESSFSVSGFFFVSFLKTEALPKFQS